MPKLYPFLEQYDYADIDKDLGKLDITNIKGDQIRNTEQAKEVFDQSGLQIIRGIINKFLPNIDYDYYIDYSYLVSSLRDQRLDDFLLIFNPNNFISVDKVKSFYYPIYEVLRNEKKGLYYHKDFFLASKMNADNYILYCNKDSSENIDIIDLIRKIEKEKLTSKKDSELKVVFNEIEDHLGISSVQLKDFNFDKFVEEESHTGLNKKSLNTILYKLFCNYFLSSENTQNPKPHSYLISIPIIGFPAHKTKKENITEPLSGQGALFFFLVAENEINESKRNELSQILFYVLKDIAFSYIINSNYNLLKRYKLESLKSSIISILIDSYAHNISAHSMVALEAYFRRRAEKLEKKIYVNENAQEIVFERRVINSKQLHYISKQSQEYYKILGLDDQTNTDQYLSLADIIRLNGNGFETEKIFEGHSIKLKESENPDQRIVAHPEKDEKGELKQDEHEFPVPVDYALWQFVRFLKGKAAFWSGVTRDLPFGGEHVSLYDLLYKYLADNPFYLGNIASSEGIYKLNIKIGLDKNFEKDREGDELKFYDFVQVVLPNGELQNNVSTIPAKISTIDENSFVGFNLAVKSKMNKNHESELEINYSKYGFVKLGKDFELLRVVLQSAKKTFMPGGLVGIHSFLTIIENTIRNVKHYKHHIGKDDYLDENGLTILVTLEQMDLFNYRKPEQKQGSEKWEHRLYRVGVALGHTLDKEKNYNIQKILGDKLFEEVVESESGKPRLGGTSQDKICSAMLLNNFFMSVEKIETGRDFFYYPWIHPKRLNIEDLKQGKTFNDQLTQKLREKALSEENKTFFKSEKQKIIEQHVNTSAGDYLFKYFNVWASDEVINIIKGESKNQFDKYDNKARFRIGVVIEPYTINEYIKENGRNIFRLIEHNNYVDRIQIAYELWNKKIFQTGDNDLLAVICDVPKDSNNNVNPIFGYSRIKQFDKFDLHKCENFIASDANILFAHGSNSQPKKVLNYRSHGVLIEKFARNKDISQGIDCKNISNLFEFIETISISIKIWDNRIYEQINNNFLEKYRKNLRLSFFQESREVENELEYIKSSLKTIFVTHLSFLENLKNNYDWNDENVINWFFKKYLNYIENTLSNFTLVIVSGRGNAEWFNKINPEHVPFILYKPIESLLDAVNDAVIYGDDFQLKYNICKTLIGS